MLFRSTDGTTGRQVAIPPSLLISAIGIVPDVRRCCTMDLKGPGNLLYILGETRRELGGSSYYRLYGWVGNRPPTAAEAGPATARALHRTISEGLARACHDCAEGGLGVALAEMALAGGLGAEVNLADVPVGGADRAEWSVLGDDWVLFSESNGRYLVEVAPEDAAAFEGLLEGVPHGRIGATRDDGVLLVTGHGGEAFALTVDDLREAWRGHLNGGTGEEGDE